MHVTTHLLAGVILQVLNPANVQAVFKKSNLQFQPILKNTTDAQNVCIFVT